MSSCLMSSSTTTPMLEDAMSSSTALTTTTTGSGSIMSASLPPSAFMLTNDVIMDDPETLDLTGSELKKLLRAAPDCTLNTTTLILDDNQLERLDNIHTYQCIEKLSVQNNRLIRMFQVSKLSHLKILNLTSNHITLMEGLKELKLLTWLGLGNNHIKNIEQLNQNVHLEHVDLSGNQISHLSDLSYLKNLKVLLLHKNQINSLRGCEKFLPLGLTTLTLNGNQLADLCEVSSLSHLMNLEQLTVANNPCIDQPKEESLQFDYRPYVINWCLTLRILDGILVGAKESLKAEWMYSQSRGRHFTVGQHTELLEYLLQVCPLHPGEDWQEDKKLNFILSKVQEHQQSLREPTSLPPIMGCPTLPRSNKERLLRRDSGSMSAAATGGNNSSASTTPTATPVVHRRSSLGTSATSGAAVSSPIMTRSNVRRSSSRTSPSPVRRRNLTPTTSGFSRGSPAAAASEAGLYSLSLPRSLYGDDINGNNNNNIASFDASLMTQSCDPSKLIGAIIDNGAADLMTASLDPSILMANMAEGARVSDAWGGHDGVSSGPPQLSRPSSLFPKHSAGRQDVKDLYLQDLSDGEVSQSMIYSRLQSRLNPVPESLNSPDIAPTTSASLVRGRDDPIRVYNRELAISSSTVSTASSSKSADAKFGVAPAFNKKPMSTHTGGNNNNNSSNNNTNNKNNGYNSSSSEGETTSRQRPPASKSSGEATGPSSAIPTSQSALNKQRSSSASKSQVRKTQVTNIKSPYVRGKSAGRAVSAASAAGPAAAIRRQIIMSLQEDELAALLRHSADDEDDGEIGDEDAGLLESEASGPPSMTIAQTTQPVGHRHQSRKSRSTRRSTSISADMMQKAVSPARNKTHQESTKKYAPDKYSDRESVTPRSATLPSQHAKNSNSSSRRPSDARITSTSRPSSATVTSSTSRPRSNTVNTMSMSMSATSSPRGGVNSLSRLGSASSQTAATTIQKNWRGHATRNNDERVQDLKDEVKSLRTDQHIKHLTKELSAAKLALERERKLRALQMDAIKVLWKEVQILDERNKSDGDGGASNGGVAASGVGQARVASAGRTRPSGVGGSKISSRASEHSIAKLMETLEATAGLRTPRGKSDFDDTRSSLDQSSPPHSMESITGNGPSSLTTGSSGGGGHGQDAVEALSRTCTSLQQQVEMLQSSLTGVVQFMTAFSAFDVQQQQQQQRTRHSSAASTTNQDSFCYYPSVSGPMSLPFMTSSASSVLDPSITSRFGPASMSASIDGSFFQPQQPSLQQQDPHCSSATTASTNGQSSAVTVSQSFDCLAQPDLITPKADLPSSSLNNQSFVGVETTRLDLSLESSGESDGLNVLGVIEVSHHGSGGGLEAQRRDRSKSPRPQTLPGLLKDGDISPSMSKMASKSPVAPTEVKAFANNLVEGLLSDTMAKQASSDAEDERPMMAATTGNSAAAAALAAAAEETDVSLSLAAEEDVDDEPLQQPEVTDPNRLSLPAVTHEDENSSHVDTDSLEEPDAKKEEAMRVINSTEKTS